MKAAILLLFLSSSAFATGNHVYDCVRNLKRYEGFSSDEAVKACSGIAPQDDVVGCVRNVRRYEGLSNAQAAEVCRPVRQCK